MSHAIVPSLLHPLKLTKTGAIQWEELPKVGHNAVAEEPEVMELFGAAGWLEFWKVSKQTGFLPTAPIKL